METFFKNLVLFISALVNTWAIISVYFWWFGLIKAQTVVTSIVTAVGGIAVVLIVILVTEH